MARTKIIYFHGGPGFNGNPERNLLVAEYARRGLELIVWDEPSTNRPGGAPYRDSDAFNNLLICAEAFFLANFTGTPLLLMAHSFGANAATFIASRHPDKISHAYFFSPDLAVGVTDRNIFEFVMRDFEKHGDPRHLELKEVLDAYSGTFDANTERGFGLVVQNPRFLDYYWHNKERMREFLLHYSGAKYGLDIPAFYAVRRSGFELPAGSRDVPVTAIFGARDRVVTREAELTILAKRFDQVDVRTLSESAHYPHVEQPEAALGLIEAAHDTRASLPLS